MSRKTAVYPIKNTQVYQFKDGTYFVSFDTIHGTHEVFSGTRAEILPKLALRVQRVLHIR